MCTESSGNLDENRLSKTHLSMGVDPHNYCLDLLNCGQGFNIGLLIHVKHSTTTLSFKILKNSKKPIFIPYRNIYI
jgi:hypothetical protein